MRSGAGAKAPTRRRADPRAADLPRPRPVRGAARRAARRRADDLVPPLRPARDDRAPARRERVHGRADAVRAHARAARAERARPAATMRLFVSGSAPLLADTFAAWRERTGHTILERYGMSETVMITSNPYRPEERAPRRHRRLARCRACSVRVHDDAGPRLRDRRDRRHRGRGPERLRRLLADAREDARGVHRRRLVPHRRRRHARRRRRADARSAAART